MLDKSTVKKETFELLTKIMNDDVMKDFFLVGGTSIALQLGHRKSIDLDLFTQADFDVSDLNFHLSERYGFIERYRSGKTLKGDIDGIFIDCIRYNYPLLKPIKNESQIRLASLEDIIAMKLSAITDNGTRLKDFVDISYLSTKYTLNEMLSFYQQKFKDNNLLSPVKALLFFDGIDFKNEPVQLKNARFNWDKVKNRLISMVQNPEKIYKDFPIPKIEKEKKQ